MLWTKAGNRCAFPDCRQALVDDSNGISPGIVVGQEAHIVAKGAGPRSHESNPEGGIDSYVNIILLCPNHHTVVDKKPEVYTKQALIDMKQSHELRISYGRVDDESRPTTQLAEHQSWGGELVANAWETEDATVVVSPYGTPPVRKPNGHWRVGGARIGQLHTREPGEVHWLFDSSEARPDIEYWCAESKLHVIQETFLYDEKNFVPFAEHVFDLTKVPAPSKVTMLIQGDQSVVAQLPDLLRQIELLDRANAGDRLDDLLYQIWKVGLCEPGRVCEELIKLKGVWWSWGSYGEWVDEILEELAVVQRSRPAEGVAEVGRGGTRREIIL